jgi:hypothetical protein
LSSFKGSHSFQGTVHFGESKYQLWDYIIDLDHVQKKKRKNRVPGTLRSKFYYKTNIYTNNVVNYTPDHESDIIFNCGFQTDGHTISLLFYKFRGCMLLIVFTNASLI